MLDLTGSLSQITYTVVLIGTTLGEMELVQPSYASLKDNVFY